ncbi:Ku protein [Streptomyces noursei]|uniref:non-homologous end joining protein Ku n=1 Tax=Streptomyces noursei TaxID=1971 RepID=UPI00167A1E09|nr:Ku protein [Streptomyces noursei]MCZ1021405.1 Ku protein [Streptomyces noursei]GGX46236.1 non-homologous end joining protein Ku [Streptomyces noursei]
MRPTAKFVISFGLVTIPVAAYSTREPTASVAFTRIHTVDGGRVRNQTVCSAEGIAIPPEEVGRGYRTKAGIVALSDRDLDALPLPTAKTFALLAFVDGAAIDPLQMGQGYYLGAEGPAAVKPYVLLRDAMERHRRVGLGKIALHTSGRETLAMLRPLGRLLVLQQVRWPHQIRPTEHVVPDIRASVSADELEAAETLIDNYGPLVEDDLHDRFREELGELAAAKLAAREPHFKAGQAPPTGPVVDLMAALQESVNNAKKSRREGEKAARISPLASPAAEPDTKKARKRSTRKPKRHSAS